MCWNIKLVKLCVIIRQDYLDKGAVAMSELGTKLRDARIEKGYTLNTLQQMTKIQKKYLQAIEEGNYDEMPGSFYVRAFVKQYADMVGLDGDELLTQYGDELVVNTSEDKEIDIKEEDIIPSRVERHDTNEKGKFDVVLSYLPLVLLITIILVIIIALISAINSIGNVNQEETTVSSETTSVVSVVEPESVVSSAEVESVETETAEVELGENDILVGDQVLTLVSEPTDVTTYQLNGPFSDYEFEVEGNSFVWVGVFEDGGIVQDITINEGESVTHTVSEGVQELRIALGYPEGGTVTVNGVELSSQSDFSQETLVFILGDNVEEIADTPSVENETIELDLPEEENVEEEESGFQGPAVLDPAN